MDKFALLFLTYDNFTNKRIMHNFISDLSDKSIYIHPKFPDKVDPIVAKYIIKNLVQTEWGKLSIVDATLCLLKTAFEDEQNKWFILLSGDCLPLYDWENFKLHFEQINSNKSIFNYYGKISNYYKTSQWWILKKSDVDIIINNHTNFKHRFKPMKLPRSSGAYDEFYFLSILKWHNPLYDFTNLKITYDKWFNDIIQFSPTVYNKLLIDEIIQIKEAKSLFIRKITQDFSLKPYKPRKYLYVIHINSYTDQEILFQQLSNTKIFDLWDLIIVTNMPNTNIKSEIVDKSIFIFTAINKCYLKMILKICSDSYIQHFNLIIFQIQHFDISKIIKFDQEINKLTDTENSLFVCLGDKSLPNLKKFNLLSDVDNNIAYLFNNSSNDQIDLKKIQNLI
jgi:hypothetical protein